jgi:hypothetical protein
MVSLASDKPSIAKPVTSTATVPLGHDMVQFAVLTYPAASQKTATISATLHGRTKGATITVKP